jgi:chromosome segregation ATPase
MYNARQFCYRNTETRVDQSEFEIQLQVWKDLAISKQVLMGAATDALGLDPDCDSEELKTVLNAAIKRSIEADADISEAREQARVAIEVMEKKVQDSEQAASDALSAKEEAESAASSMQQQMQAARANNAEEVKKIKKQLTDEQKKLKVINTNLGDTPENVVKKLKALKKQKADEANDRKRAEDATRTIRKEKQTLEQRLNNIEAAIKQSAELAEKFRELHEITTSLHELAKDSDDAPEVPMLNEKLLEGIEEAAKSLEEK